MEKYRRLLGYVVPYWKRLLVAMLCGAAYSALNAALPWLIKPTVDRLFVAKEEGLLYLLPVAVVLVSLGKGMADYGQTYLMAHVGQSVIRDLRDRIYDHLQDLSLSFFHRTPTGVLISRITNDVNLVQGSVTNALTGLMKDSLSLLFLVGVAFYNDWLMAGIGILVFPWAIIPLVRFGRKIRRYTTRSQAQMGSITTVLHESISGQPIIKAFCTEGHERQRFSRENQGLFRAMMKRYRVRALSSPAMETFGGVGAAFAIAVGGYRVLHGLTTAGEFFALIAAMGMMYEPVKRLNKLNLTLQEGMAASERIFQVLDEAPEIHDAPGARKLGPVRDGIEFHNVGFRYGEEIVLDGIEFKIARGEVVALVGESGVGKTTLANLILRFFDATEGAILMDGVDIRDVTLRSLRGQIALVTQQSILFNDTVKNNIAYGKLDATEAEIQRAAEAAYAHDFILSLPKGYETVIGEAGVKLSGGQRQRLCIARALLKDPPILILDEATSSLDSRSEREVQRALEELMKGRTVLVIAHRLSTVANADRIVVLKGGRIVEIGTPGELMRARGEYYRLHRMQGQRDSRMEAAERPLSAER